MSASTRTPTSTSLKGAWTAMAERAKAHHESVQGAYEVYYGAGTRTPRPSADAPRSPAVASSASSIVSKASVSSKATSSVSETVATPEKASTWARLKQHAREHHESVNAAYELYYGGGVRRR